MQWAPCLAVAKHAKVQRIDTAPGQRRVPCLWLCTGMASSNEVFNRLTPPLANAIVPPSIKL